MLNFGLGFLSIMLIIPLSDINMALPIMAVASTFFFFMKWGKELEKKGLDK